MAPERDIHDDISAAEAALFDDPHGEVEELTLEELTEEALPAAYFVHRLQCRQGLGNAYNYDDTWFRPPSTCEMWTRTAFFNAGGVRLLLTAWRYKGGGNPYAMYSNRWVWKSTAVARAVALWRTAVSDGQGGYSDIHTFSKWASCS